VLGDEAKLRQVIGNLVGNALRYTPEGTPIEIAVGVRQGEAGSAQAVLEVRDHGPGISDTEATKVFERFYRADTSRTRDTGGSGLGLAIVAAIIGSHGGSVRVEGTDGGGATLVVSLPLREDSPGEDSIEADSIGTFSDSMAGDDAAAGKRVAGGNRLST
jgi:two-component system OmpR family sensor kinase